ncbi:MAG: hypothetical protein HZA51_15400 [Planctomycetes bacterium]|nr:hypothetical protein [Planctomycetota bacterium]
MSTFFLFTQRAYLHFLSLTLVVMIQGCGHPVPVQSLKVQTHYMSKEGAVQIKIHESGMNSALYVGRSEVSRWNGIIKVEFYYYLIPSSNFPIKHIDEVWVRVYPKDTKILLVDGQESRVIWTRESTVSFEDPRQDCGAEGHKPLSISQ